MAFCNSPIERLAYPGFTPWVRGKNAQLSFSGSAEFSAGGFRGGLCRRLGGRTGGLGRNFQAVLVHVESLLSVQAFDELARRFGNAAWKTRRIHFYGRIHRFLISIAIAESHLKRFHAAYLPFPKI